MPTRSNRTSVRHPRHRGVLVVVLASMILTGLSIQPAPPNSQHGWLPVQLNHRISSTAEAITRLPEPCTDFFNCRFQDELIRLHNYLKSKKIAAGYSPEPRTITPYPEMVRLVINTQAHGYLNLYKKTKKKEYLLEAQSRLNYILSLGDKALHHDSFDGMLGYTMYTAYELTGNPAYYALADRIAHDCLTYSNNIMNWGMMCAMSYVKAYKFTGDQTFLNAAQQVIQDTVPNQYYYQFMDGSFPHQAGYPVDTAYSMWMALEMLEIRAGDPNDPRLEASLVRLIDFLRGTDPHPGRINPDGSLNYEDMYGRYYEDLHDTKGWTDSLAVLAAVLRANGDDDKAQQVLEYLFQFNERGQLGYPDKWGYFTPSNPLANADFSVVRSSMIFWYLSYANLTPNTTCDNGQTQTCSVGQTPGVRRCLNGTYTQCLVLPTFSYQSEPACTGTTKRCVDTNCFQLCSRPGYKYCLNQSCTMCMITQPEVCGKIQCDYTKTCQ